MKYKILSTNIAGERGRKFPISELKLNKLGATGDVHAQTWNRQISIISKEHIERFSKLTEGRKAEFGEFAENITLESMNDTQVTPFDLFVNGDTVLEVTQIGKPFHAQFKELGNYVMPRVGIFCRVKSEGILKPGDFLTHIPKLFKIKIITLSDRASKGEYEDLSGPAIHDLLNKYFSKKAYRYSIKNVIIPDDAETLRNEIKTSDEYDVIITTGGTGIGPRDITVETIQPLLDKEIPGIMEMIRIKYGREKPNALLSRSVVGVIGNSLVYTLPGSVKAVNEYMNEILKTLEHLIYMLHGVDIH